jgi:hypothetical protein
VIDFAHPAYLWGALAVALPILVHLFNQRRPRPLAFGAIEFVLRSQRQKASRLRLRQILLLALRCLLIAAVAVALARPQLRPKGAQSAQASGPQATALILDASLSMRYRLGTRTLFERARSEALAALDALSADEPAVVGICAGEGGFLQSVAAPSFDRIAARRALSGAQPTFLSSDLSTCLAAAAKALGESPVLGKRIIAFSDLAAHSIRMNAPAPLVPPPAGSNRPAIKPNLVLVDAARGSELPNAAVIATAVRPAPSLGPRGYEVVATVANASKAAASGLPLSLKIGQTTVAKGFVDVPAHGMAKKTLAAVLPAGAIIGRVELARDEGQGLDEDDGQDFVVHVPRDVKALIVDGAPSSLRSRDEAFFVEAALAPARTAGRITATTLDADAAVNATLDGYDVILLLNVAAPPKPFVEKLKQAVRGRGAGLFIALGDRVDPDAYNDAFGDLLPRPLHLIKTAAEPGEGAEAHAARFGVVDWTDPLFRIFGPAERDGLSSARTLRYALLKPSGSSARTIASFDDGAPALIESRFGAGRVILYTSSASRTWTDWPIRVSFLPVLQQAVSFLASALEERQPQAAAVGAEREVSPPQGLSVMQLLGPDGKPVQLKRAKPDAPEASAGPLFAPGIYRPQVGPPGGSPHDDPSLAFVALLDPKESDLSRVDEAELKAQLGGGGSAQVAASSEAAQGVHGKPLWSPLLLLGALALLGEGLLTRR